MAGINIATNNGNVHIDVADATGEAIVGSRVWRWEYTEHIGVLWVGKDGQPVKNQNPPQAVWEAFEKWLDEYERKWFHP